MTEEYRRLIREARDSGFNLKKRVFYAEELFPKKKWDGVGLIGYMLEDPYTGEPAVEKLDESIFKVAVRLVTPRGINRYEITLQLRDDWQESRKIFNPLLDRFVAGEDYTVRPVKKSDSGRIRNELQTLCSQALEHFQEKGIQVDFSLLDDLTMPASKKKALKEILLWFRENHPIWFNWLDVKE